MDKTIHVEIRTVYGKDAIYIISNHALPVERLTGKKTIDKFDIAALKSLGFNVAVPAKMGLLL